VPSNLFFVMRYSNGLLNLQKERINIISILKLLASFLFFIFFLITFFRIPVYNYDFWWHLATGKYIVENKSLPQNDPFAYTADDTVSKREAIILKGNWLADVTFYKLYSLWSEKGIIILRSFLLLLFLVFVFLNIKKQNPSYLIALILTTVVFLIARKSGGERPQLFTFTIFSLVYYLLEDYRVNGSKKVYLIPFLAMLLSNMHPGYIVCILIVTIYLIGEGSQYFFGNTQKGDALKGMLIIWTLTILMSMINPNGPIMLTRLFSIHGEHIKGIVEFKTPFSLYLSKALPVDYPYVTFLLFSLLGLKYLKRLGLTHILLLVVFTYMSLFAIRYVIFYMCVSAPILARIIGNIKDEKIFERVTAFLRREENLLFMATCIIGIFLVFNAIPSFGGYKYKAETFYSVPKGAADFLSKLKIKGNMFNEYGFGGYLIWRLYPDKKVFIDGRALEPSVYKEYQTLAYVIENPHESWKDIIAKYNISYVIMPPLLHHGDIYPIVEKLFDSDEWVLIYRDHLSLIFLRNDDKNLSLVEKMTIDKVEGLQTIVIQAASKAMKNKTNPYFLISLGKVFFKMGKIDEATKAFNMAHKRAPDNKELRFWLERLQMYKNTES